MKLAVNPQRDSWKELCSRVTDSGEVIEQRARSIVERVRDGGDRAILAVEAEIAGLEALPAEASFAVTREELEECESLVPDSVKEAIRVAAANIEKFHKAQRFEEIKVETAPGVCCMQRSLPIERVGIYIPGGSAPLFSTVLMLAIPAKVAGCRRIVMCTPANAEGRANPQTLWAAHYCGVDTIFKVGGASAIAAMAYGTESIPAVDKIFGPGNRYVTAAKQYVGGKVVSIDMPAGPSEVMVLADSSANPAFVAADLLSQAEHGADSQAILVCGSQSFAEQVLAEIESQRASMPRNETISKALEGSRIVVFEGASAEEQRKSIIAFANLYAAEHLIISMENPYDVADEITAAGSIFIGNWSPESAGDYASGTNHTLPTSGWAKSCSGVNLDSFCRKVTLQDLSPEGLRLLADTIVTMAEAEGLEAHANAVRVRLKA